MDTLSALRKEFHKAVNEMFARVEEVAELEVSSRAQQIQTSMQEKLDRALGGGRIKLGVKGAKPGTQPCKLTGQPSDGPRYNYLTKEVHGKIYANRSKEEGNAVVLAILAARVKGETHPEDPSLTPPVVPAPETSPETSTEQPTA